MRSSSKRSANLSDALPISDTLSVSYPVFSPIPVTINALIPQLKRQLYRLPGCVTYRDLAHFFRQHSDALGVLITDEANEPTQIPVGMVSRQRLMQWRSHRSIWRTVLNQRLSDYPQWWKEAGAFLQIDHHLPLQDAIDHLLAQDRENIYAEPIVINTPDEVSLCDRHSLFVAYTQLTRSEQIALVEPAIETLRRQQQLILNAIGEGVYGVDLQGNATFVNPAGARMVGWDPQELIGKSMHQVLHHSRPDHSPYPRDECPIYAAFQDGIIHRASEEVFWCKDGTSFPVEYISTPMRDEQGKLVGAVIAFRDITQRKWAEAVLHRTNEDLEQRVRDRTIELQQANEQLKELSELRSRVVTMVCHEFRNPLNNILLSVSSIGRYDTQLTADQKETYLLGIQENVERMTQMIDAVLIIGRVEAKRIDVQPSQFDLISFCQGLIADVSLDANSQEEGKLKRLQFISRSKRLMVTLDPCLLRSILTNILANALRYAPEGSIQFKVLKHGDRVTVSIADQGIGIPPDDLPYLFEPFHRGRNVSNIAGTGLGLNIVKRFVELQGGHVDVSSQLGRGTTFHVMLPLHYRDS